MTATSDPEDPVGGSPAPEATTPDPEESEANPTTRASEAPGPGGPGADAIDDGPSAEIEISDVSDPETAAPEVTGTETATATVVEVSADVPDLEMADVASGSRVQLASLVTGDKPLLLWFWAPH